MSIQKREMHSNYLNTHYEIFPWNISERHCLVHAILAMMVTITGVLNDSTFPTYFPHIIQVS